MRTEETAPTHKGSSAETNNVSFDFTDSINSVFHFTAGVGCFTLYMFLFTSEVVMNEQIAMHRIYFSYYIS